LDKLRTNLLDKNYARIVEELDCEELINVMFNEKCISRRHMESLQAKTTTTEKNKQFLNILHLRSIANFNTCVCYLADHQRHVAKYLNEDTLAGGMVLVFP